ncbi:hypothetical protein MKQ70_33780 [Chitinophaga sedimenti]|uniref:hypothetical protein n=1 Tax=Chitinophaga sedimenti TaxID=2033606 RepID=UPI002003300B|nr:hypothetical protein [Chitinophaga sedimenti]MCK7559651.1 hypothetical protein [Chitinophaga sedimenti]
MSYLAARQYQLSVDAFQQLINLDTGAIRPARIPYAKALGGLARYDEALAVINQYMAGTKNPSPAGVTLKGNFEFAVKAKQNPAPFEPRNLGDNINSVYPEYFPSLTIDDETLIFTRRLSGNEDFFISRRDSAQPWQKPGYGRTHQHSF